MRSRPKTCLEIVRNVTILSVALLSLTGWQPASAQDANKNLGWAFIADIAAVWTAGNSESSTYGLEGTLRHTWPKDVLQFVAGGTQTQSTLRTRTATGTGQDDFVLTVDERTEKTAELFYARARYDRTVSKYFHLLGGVDWLRNTFAGIDSRTLLGLGAGNIWRDDDTIKLLTDYAFTYTFQEDVVDNPFTKNDFPGLRVGYDLSWTLTESTKWLSLLAVDWNLDNTDDVRADWTNSLPVSISSKLELKPSLQLLWRNDPSLTEVDLTGGAPGQTVLVALDELDSLFTLALVVKL